MSSFAQWIEGGTIERELTEIGFKTISIQVAERARDPQLSFLITWLLPHACQLHQAQQPRPNSANGNEKLSRVPTHTGCALLILEIQHFFFIYHRKVSYTVFCITSNTSRKSYCTWHFLNPLCILFYNLCLCFPFYLIWYLHKSTYGIIALPSPFLMIKITAILESTCIW